MELLTGKCKEDFEKWYYNDKKHQCSYMTNQIKKSRFESSTLSMQYGVLVDFFDSAGMHLGLEPYFDNDMDLLFKYNLLFVKDIDYQNSYTKREHVRQQAIKKANELYNLNNK